MKSAVKRLMVAAVLWMVFTPVQAAELESGFMDTKWSSPAKDLKGFTRVGGSGKIAYYVNPQRTYTFFGTEVPDDVVYGFYEDKFFAVYVNIDGIDVFSQIKSYIQHKYGAPRKTTRETRGDLTTYVWKLNQTQIKFKHHETSGKMKMSFYYLPIANQVNAEMKKDEEDEPPEPVFPLSAVRQSEAVRSQMEFMSF
ncbi:MAG TPA: hypothetical protein VLR50_20210 [Desulfobacterales bacterium]|nr:hypothetical protein [Desulfobacterales bacterium]